MGKTSPELFNVFREEVRRWLHYFGIKEYRVEFEHISMKSVRADVIFDMWGKTAIIRLNKNWGKDEPTEHLVRKSAFHEVCELMISKIHNMLLHKATYVQDDVEEEIHRLIRILENTVFVDVVQLNFSSAINKMRREDEDVADAIKSAAQRVTTTPGDIEPCPDCGSKDIVCENGKSTYQMCGRITDIPPKKEE